MPDPHPADRVAGLSYSSDEQPGWTRRRRGRGFSYHDASGRLLRGERSLKRIRSLVIPPAWTEVWISPDAAGHLQATGRDERGRKQYLYHPLWSEVRGEAKFAKLTAFATELPSLRRRLQRDLADAGPTPDRTSVTAAIVRLLDLTLMRIGNVAYAEDNDSFGLTTLEDRHVKVKGQDMDFSFRGKSGQLHELSLRNKRLAGIVRRCQELPGQALFRFHTDDGDLQTISSEDVNAYLRETVGQEHSAKDFRTWAGTVMTAENLHGMGQAESITARKRNLVAAIRKTAGRLGNTPAVCREGYVHPKVMDRYLEGSFGGRFERALSRARQRGPEGLRLAEAATLHFLEAA